MSKELAAFHDLLLPELAGCTTALVDFHVVQVAREFCTKTRAWRGDFEPLDLVANQAAYDLCPLEPQSEVANVLRLTKGAELIWQDRQDERAGESATVAKYVRGDVPFELSGDLKTIIFMADEVPTATAAAGMAVYGAMKPRMGATRLPDLLVDQFSEAMRFGVLYRLMAQGNKPWTDRALAIAYLSNWNSHLSLAAVQGQTGHVRRRLRVKSHG